MTTKWTAAIFVLLILVVGACNAFADDEVRVRWDIVGVDLSTTPPTILPGGTEKAAAIDRSSISLSGSGTFAIGDSEEVNGGGDWTTFAPDGTQTGSGSYRVTALVRFDLAPGTFPFGDAIGNPADARAGLAVLRIKYSDRSRGILVVSCHLAGTPNAVFEGITATKGFVDYFNTQPVVGTLFHIIAENED